LNAAARKYAVFENAKNLNELKNFLSYLEFNESSNPVEFSVEEKALIEEMLVALSENEYEKEVLFLSSFIPKIKGYFTANITAGALADF